MFKHFSDKFTQTVMDIIVNWDNYSALQVNNNNCPKHSATKLTGGYNVLMFLFDFYSIFKTYKLPMKPRLHFKKNQITNIFKYIQIKMMLINQDALVNAFKCHPHVQMTADQTEPIQQFQCSKLHFSK